MHRDYWGLLAFIETFALSGNEERSVELESLVFRDKIGQKTVGLEFEFVDNRQS